MAAPSLDSLRQKAIELGVEFNPDVTATELKEKINTHIAFHAIPTVLNDSPEAQPQSPQSQEKMIPLSDVKALIAEALAQQKEQDKPIKVKRVTEHHAHVWRLNGKWVIDFADRNYDYEKGQKIDQYIQLPIHAYQIYNQQKREFEAWIKVIFQDGTMEELPLNRYVERRTLVYCPIIKRHPKDLSYSIGEVEKKKEGKDGTLVGTGVMVDQEVNMYAEILEVRTPEGDIFKLPDYVIC